MKYLHYPGFFSPNPYLTRTFLQILLLPGLFSTDFLPYAHMFTKFLSFAGFCTTNPYHTCTWWRNPYLTRPFSAHGISANGLSAHGIFAHGISAYLTFRSGNFVHGISVHHHLLEILSLCSNLFLSKIIPDRITDSIVYINHFLRWYLA